MKNIFTFSFFLLVIFSTWTTTTTAYELVDTESRRLDENHTLYMITYKAGYLNRAAEFPVTATRKAATSSMSVIYQFENASGTVPAQSGVSASTIVSDATKVNGVFPIAEGENQLFTLIVVRAGAERLEPEAMRITAIPYITIDGTKRGQTAIPNDALEDHITPFVK